MIPSEWVDRIFARLAVRYAALWLRLWEGLDMHLVKADWAELLSGFTTDDIAYALANLPPDRPPTAGQFRELCRRSPRTETLRLGNQGAKEPAPPHIAARLKAITERKASEDPKVWAYRLMQREQGGDRLTITQREAWRDALRPGGSDHVLEETLRGVS